MRVRLNGAARDVVEGTTVAALIEELGLRERRIAVEINRDIVARGAYDECSLREGDEVEIIHFVGGG